MSQDFFKNITENDKALARSINKAKQMLFDLRTGNRYPSLEKHPHYKEELFIAHFAINFLLEEKKKIVDIIDHDELNQHRPGYGERLARNLGGSDMRDPLPRGSLLRIKE